MIEPRKPRTAAIPDENVPNETLSVHELAQIEHLTHSDALKLTIDQLRTVALLASLKTDLAVADTLNRQQSSVRSQIRTVNDYFKNMCQEALGVFGERGQPFAFTETGQAAAVWANKVLQTLVMDIERQRRSVGQSLLIATTTFTLPHLRQAWESAKWPCRNN